MRNPLHRRCYNIGEQLEAENSHLRREADFWHEEYRQQRDEVWRLQDEVIDRVPAWWLLIAVFLMLGIGVFIGNLP